MSVSASFRLFSTKFHPSTTAPIFKTLTLSTPFLPTTPSFFKSITIQSIPTKLSPLNSSSSSPISPSLQPIEELPPKLEEIVKLFQSVSDPKTKYQQLLFYGKNLKPLEPKFKTTENKVQGCVSQDWVRAYFDSEDKKNVAFKADSESVLTKGLASLLVNGLSGQSVQDILKVSPDFVVLLGLQQSFTPSRNNGFLNMLKLMQKKTKNLYVEAEKGIESGNENGKQVESAYSGLENDYGINGYVEAEKGIAKPVERVNLGLKNDSPVNGDSEVESVSSTRSIDDDDNNSKSGVLGSRGERIWEKLMRELQPVELEVEDISYQHAGHAGVRGNSNGETHFNLKVVSKEFEGKSLVKRHRLIYGLLEEELQSGLHALSIVAKTPTEV